MTLYQPSTKAVSAACQEIADTVGASGDAEMTNRAGRSLFAALQHFNNKADWNFMLTEANPVGVFAPFTVSGVSASAGQASAACPAGHGLLADDFIAGSGFGAGARISATAASGFGINGTITFSTSGVQVTTATATRDMYSLPSDLKKLYTARLIGAQRTLRPVGRRLYDRTILNEQENAGSWWYDVFMFGSKGKIRLLPPNPSADLLLMRYYRRMTIPTSTATADVLDIHQDFEPYLMAYAKATFLIDKGEGRGEQMKTWFSIAQEGLVSMIREQTRVPDEDLMFIPGHYTYGNLGDNVTRDIAWTYE